MLGRKLKVTLEKYDAWDEYWRVRRGPIHFRLTFSDDLRNAGKTGQISFIRMIVIIPLLKTFIYFF